MRIVVLVKEVPDTYEDRSLSLDTGLADRAASDAVIDEACERALEVALTYADAHSDAEVVVLGMAPASASASFRKALAIGADRAVHLVDDSLAGADLVLTADALAAAAKFTGFDLVITGNQSTDGAAGVLPAMIAELLDVPHATGLSSVTIEENAVVGNRFSDGAALTVHAELPAVVSVTEALPDARFPSFKGIMAAKKKPYETLSLSDVGIVMDEESTARSIMLAVSERPPRPPGVKVVDQGDAADQLAEFLVQNRFV